MNKNKSRLLSNQQLTFDPTDKVNQSTISDKQWMQLALKLAKKGTYTTDPNPNVGCVIVLNQKLVGQGFHAQAGQDHAEIVALKEAQGQAQGATIYVTLEPCSHHGKTPPCALALIQAKVARVVIGMQDPNPKVSGKGIEILKKAGIQVDLCLDFVDELEALNRGFLKRMRTGFPFVQLKLAASLDGKIALENGESQWITSIVARQDVQNYRAQSSLILSTSQTVIADQASLTVRSQDFSEQLLAQLQQQDYPKLMIRQPIRCILDAHERLTGDETLFKTDSPIWLIRKNPFKHSNSIRFIDEAITENGINFKSLFRYFGTQEINSVWIEAGSKLAGALIQAQVIDELVLYYAPKLLGDNALSMFQFSIQHLTDAPTFKIRTVEHIGDDLKIILKKE